MMAFGLVGNDGNVWGFYDTREAAETVRDRQNDPSWYHIAELNKDDYIDPVTGDFIKQQID